MKTSRLVALLIAAAAWTGVAAASSVAATPAPGWAVSSAVYPTYLAPGATGQLQVDFVDDGAAVSSGPITVTDTLPPGLVATKAGGAPSGQPTFDVEEEEHKFGGARWHCSIAGSLVTCVSDPEFLPQIPVPESEKFVERIGIDVQVEEHATLREHTDCAAEPALCNQVAVEGGGATEASRTANPVTISMGDPGFGFGNWGVTFSNADGTSDTRAGSHPYELTTFLGFNELSHQVNGTFEAGGEIRNLDVDLPPGFFGDPTAVPRCTRTQIQSPSGKCPRASQIGVDDVITSGEAGGATEVLAQIAVYNMVPPPGVPVEFGLDKGGARAFFDAGVRSGHGYGIVEHVVGIAPLNPGVDENILTIWGVPADPSHDFQRNFNGECPSEGKCASGVTAKPFLTLPTACQGPQAFTVRGVSTWQQGRVDAEASIETHDKGGNPAGFTGCDKLSIEPTLSVAPDTAFVDTPAGLTVGLHVPQESLELPEGLVSSTIRNAQIMLPKGLVINPGQAAGLTACGQAEANIAGEGPASCPNSSRVGSVKIRTPLLEGTEEPELEGGAFVLQSNPPNLKLLITASADGIFLKLPADVHLDEATGQVTGTLTETPELPFTDFKLSFSGGAQAALATPTGCGTYMTTSDFTPWTSPFGEDVFPSSAFLVAAGTGGGPCLSSLPFAPVLTAGSTTDQAGGFTSFSLLLQSGDDRQRIEKLQFRAPAGLSGMISRVPLCGEPQAAQGTCSSASQIGHTVVASGPGPYPLVIPEPGKPPAAIYLTGPYQGAPFGLSIVTPVIAGPFDLGRIVTRAKIEVDPHTAQVIVTTDPLPQIIDGVPTDLRTVDAVIDRPGFMFNPTNCTPSSFSGTAWGTPPPGTEGTGSTAAISSHFGVGSCQSLKFKPDFKVSTSGKTSKADGVSLDAKILYPTGTPGSNQASSQSNVARVKVDLPKQLPSRLTTLQKACTAAQFDANPAGCPAASIIGHATAITPVLPVPVSGPAYFVSHGGEAFPSLIMVLQGYGVTVDLEGTTFISKAGITSSTFKQVPDVPITSFDLNLPQGKYSALTANLPASAHGSFCGQTLKMPTEFVGQNGAEIHQSTPITVEGCSTSLSFTHSIHKHAVRLSVYVPGAGRVTAAGKGLTSRTGIAKGQEELAFTLTEKKPGKLKTTVKVGFTPSAGKDRRKQFKSAKLVFEKR